MNRNSKRLLAGLAATGVLAGGLAAGGVALASAGSPASPATVAATTPANGPCEGGAYGMRGMWSGQPVMKAAADYLGITQAQLRAQLDSGKSLADVASARQKPVSGLKSAILAAATSWINASTRLSATQKATMISEMKSHLDDMVNGTAPAGLHMGDGPGMGRMGSPGWGADSPMGGMRGF